MTTNLDVEFHIRHNFQWTKVPQTVKQILGNSQKEYDKLVVNYSLKNQLRYKGNLVRYVRKDEKQYYSDLVKYSREHLMLFPYHLSDIMVKGLRMTPFAYYITMMADIMAQEKSYDSLPNFTASDCLRLLGIGRNQFIDLMNESRSNKKFFRRKHPRELLPTQPVDSITIDPWWIVHIGFVTDDDVNCCSPNEKLLVDRLIDQGAQRAGDLDYKAVHALYRRGLIYLEVPVADSDLIIVPPLEGFVMNRVLGDYFETLLYKVFVSLDEHTSIADLASVLEIDLQLVKNAISMYLRLGYAKKKGLDLGPDQLHASWHTYTQQQQLSQASKRASAILEPMLIDWSSSPTADTATTPADSKSLDGVTFDGIEHSSSSGSLSAIAAGIGLGKRVALLFDSTLTAFLMMGNLSPGLKSHAVTMFEAGKMADESLDNLLAELDKVASTAEGEAQRYFEHAIALRDTIRCLRTGSIKPTVVPATGLQLVDLVRCESLLSLDAAACTRLLNKNYAVLISVAPLSSEIRPISSCIPYHIGPAIPEVNSVWFRLFLYQLTGCGPPSLLLSRGTKLRHLPPVFYLYDRLLVTPWGHDPGVLPASNALVTLNETLQHSATLVQAYGWQQNVGETRHIPFPLDQSTLSDADYASVLQRIGTHVDLKHACGYVTLLRTGARYDWPRPMEDEQQLPVAPRENLDSSNRCALSAETNDFVLTGGGSSVSNDSVSGSGGATNGVRDDLSAKILASEVDSLNNDVSSLEPVGSGCLNAANGSGISTTSANGKRNGGDLTHGRRQASSEWLVLDCHFGIPLFDLSLNHDVLERLQNNGLFTAESLEDMLQTSRALSLKLLDFIGECQDQSASATAVDAAIGSGTVCQPSRCLLYSDGQLHSWPAAR